MHSLLKQYHPYIVDRHAKTLLPQVSLFLSDKIQSLRQGCQVSSEPLFFGRKLLLFWFSSPPVLGHVPSHSGQHRDLPGCDQKRIQRPPQGFTMILKRRSLALDWRNVFIVSGHKLASELQVHKKYDLKGSTVDREASEKERGKSLPTLKVRNNAEDFTWHKNAFLAT